MFKIIRNLKERKRIEKELKELKDEYFLQRRILNRLLKLVDQLEINEDDPISQRLLPKLEEASNILIRKEVDILELELHLEDLK